MDVLQDAHGQILEAFSISAGLDYPGIGPEHSYFHDIKRATYVPVTDQEALEAFQLLSKVEGIIPALESSHAIAYAVKLAKEMGPEKSMIVCLSGRGDKDVVQVKDRLEQERRVRWEKTLTEHLQELKDQQQGIFVPYIMAGDHEKGLSRFAGNHPILEELGVSAIEVGIPFRIRWQMVL